jgi:hypothetical protein
MFMVGGGILVHGIAPLHHVIEDAPGAAAFAFNVVCGVVAGAIVLGVVTLVQRIRKRP